jgi:hypothetical protein
MKNLSSILFLLALVMFGGAFIAAALGNNDSCVWLLVLGWCFNILGVTI